MILGLGLDLVDIQRFERSLTRWGERMTDRVFTQAEREHCAGRLRAAECLASAFAAKEAFLKALGTGVARGVRWRDVELVRRPGRPPELAIRGAALRHFRKRGMKRVWVSITHEGRYGAAAVVIEGV